MLPPAIVQMVTVREPQSNVDLIFCSNRTTRISDLEI